MSYPIEVIANWFLLKESMPHKKLQKLCYYAQAWGYALYDAPFINEAFQAWVHGPVSPVLYEKYKDSYLKKLTPEDIDMSMIEEDDQDFLERVWLNMAITHQTAWRFLLRKSSHGRKRVLDTKLWNLVQT